MAACCSTTTKPERMSEQIKPFLADSSLPPLCDQHLNEIAAAGAAGPYRHWGVNWPYFVSQSGSCTPRRGYRSVPYLCICRMARFMLTKFHAQTQGEGGIEVAPEGASWRNKPETRHDLAIVASS